MKICKRLAALVCPGVLAAIAAGIGWAGPPLTTVQDILYKADGTPFQGIVTIEWKSFDAADTSNIATNSLTLRIVNGLLRARLVPTTNASAGAYYSVRYSSDGKVQFLERWAVPPSSASVRVRDIRIAAPPGGVVGGQTGPIEIAGVTGLQEELNLRPVMGLNYSPSRAVVINGNGELDAAVGAPDECVRVDGSSGPCGGPGGAVGANFVDGETPTGAVNGSNASFTLSQVPLPAASLLLYRNGILQKQAVDYSISGNVVQFVPVSTPQVGDILVASFRTAGTGGTIPQVLCTGVGAATSQAITTSLASCSIPANLVRPGDRVEVLFDYSHEGSTVGFEYQVRWGTTAIVLRSAPASVTQASGRATAGAHAAGAQWATLSWGPGLALASDAGNAPDDAANGLTVDFHGRMTAPTTETLTLRNYSVVRYPAP